MGNRMKSLFSALIIISLGASQDAPSSPELSNSSETAALDTVSQEIPSGLDTGYKGFVWGSQSGTTDITIQHSLIGYPLATPFYFLCASPMSLLCNSTG